MLPGGSAAKNPPANAGDARDEVSIPGSGRSPGEGHGNSLQYSCLENPMERGTWRATVHEVTEESCMTEQLNNNKMCSNTYELGGAGQGSLNGHSSGVEGRGEVIEETGIS